MNRIQSTKAEWVVFRWDAYPVPQIAPGEYSDNTKWGIVPAWGFAIVTESKIPSLRTGTLLFGYWPTASAPVDLELQESVPKGNWVETSKHREQVMSVYNTYQERGHFEIPAGQSIDFQKEQLDNMAWASLFGATWLTGYLLNRYTFASDPETQPVVGPLGKLMPWTKDNADITQTVMVSLSASGKTARGFAWQVLTQRAQGSGPLAFLQVTQAPDTIGAVASRHARVPSEAFSYSQLDTAVDRAAGFKPRKLIIVDFGGRDNALRKFMGYVNEKPELKEAESVILQIGGEQKVPLITLFIPQEDNNANFDTGILDGRSPGHSQRHATVQQGPLQRCKHPRWCSRICRWPVVSGRPTLKLRTMG